MNNISFLNESELDCFRFIKAIENGVVFDVPELAVRLMDFDHYYGYTDSMSVFKNAEAEEARLLDEINKGDFSEEVKVVLRSGLRTRKGLIEQWPILRHHDVIDYPYNDPKEVRACGMLELALNGVTNETLRSVDQLLEPIIKALAYRTMTGGTVYTKAAPDPRELSGKVSVPDNIQAMYLDFERNMDKATLTIMRAYLTTAPTINGYSVNGYPQDRGLSISGPWVFRIRAAAYLNERDFPLYPNNVVLYLNPTN